MEIKRSQIVPHSMAFLRGGVLPVSLMGLLLLGGCQKQPAPQTTPPAETPQSSTAQPPASQPAAMPSPAMPAKAPAAPATAVEKTPAPPPAPKVYVIPSGTAVVVRTGEELSAKNNNVGDTFSGTLSQSLTSEGRVLVKAGTPVSGVVVASKGQGRFKGDGALGVQLKAIGSRPVSTTSYEKTAGGKGKRSAGMIGGGTGAGALIGGLAGGGKGALIGALAGAGAGTAGAAFTGNKNVSIPAESTITFTLTAPIRVTAKEE